MAVMALALYWSLMLQKCQRTTGGLTKAGFHSGVSSDWPEQNRIGATRIPNSRVFTECQSRFVLDDASRYPSAPNGEPEFE